ncbi:MAG: hypothetical protein ACK5YT_05005 [Bacteroidota bacterium]|nr:hypothetical protein [Cytophagales bacterium]
MWLLKVDVQGNDGKINLQGSEIRPKYYSSKQAVSPMELRWVFLDG